MGRAVWSTWKAGVPVVLPPEEPEPPVEVLPPEVVPVVAPPLEPAAVAPRPDWRIDISPMSIASIPYYFR